MSENKYEFNDNTSEIISAALEVHKAIGPGFLEVVYQRALFYEMKLREIEFTREAEIDILYKGKVTVYPIEEKSLFLSPERAK